MSPRSDQPRRRSFTAKYKLDVLAEYDAADPAARGGVSESRFHHLIGRVDVVVMMTVERTMRRLFGN